MRSLCLIVCGFRSERRGFTTRALCLLGLLLRFFQVFGLKVSEVVIPLWCSGEDVLALKLGNGLSLELYVQPKCHVELIDSIGSTWIDQSLNLLQTG